MITLNLLSAKERRRLTEAKRARDRYREDPEHRRRNNEASAERRAKVRADPEGYAQMRDAHTKWRRARRQEPAYAEAERKKQREWMRNYRKTDKGRNIVLNNKLRSAYGITLADVQEMLEEQGAKCAACGTTLSISSKTVDRACVDHNHATGRVRGLLCARCNSALGMVREDVNILCGLAEYLEKYKDVA